MAAAAAAPDSASENAGAARVAVPMPSGIAWPIMKRFQALFILVAHAEVRSRGDAGKLSVKEQEAVILESFKSHVRLWYRDDADLLNSSPNFPQCPQALKRVGTGTDTDVLNCMLSTTQTGNNAFTGASMLRKAGSLKTDFLKLIADWNMLCGNNAQSATIGRPGTGEGPEEIYQKMIAVDFRRDETSRVLKLRVAQRQCQ